MIITTLLYGCILGTISGLFWAYSLGIPFISGSKYGGAIGIIIGLLFYLFYRLAKGEKRKREVAAASGSMMMGIFMLSLIVGFVVGMIRWIT